MNYHKLISRSAAFILMFVAQMVGAQNLYEIPEGAETRWASGENPRGEPGRADEWWTQGIADRRD